jgi:hypothetical protein
MLLMNFFVTMGAGGGGALFLASTAVGRIDSSTSKE